MEHLAIVEIFKSRAWLSRELGLSDNAVTRWFQGSGKIPSKYWPRLIEIAAENGQQLCLTDFYPPK